MESDDVGRSSSDRRRDARAASKPGRGDRRNGKGGTRKSATVTVRQLMRQIARLSEADRLLLERQLAERAEAEWLRSAKAARRTARARGIDQTSIDRAVEEVRYPPRRNGERG